MALPAVQLSTGDIVVDSLAEETQLHRGIKVAGRRPSGSEKSKMGVAGMTTAPSRRDTAAAGVQGSRQRVRCRGRQGAFGMTNPPSKMQHGRHQRQPSAHGDVVVDILAEGARLHRGMIKAEGRGSGILAKDRGSEKCKKTSRCR